MTEKSEYYVVISDDKQAEILYTPYEIEKITNIIKMYKRLQKFLYKKNKGDE